MKNLFKKYTEFNFWANKRISSALRPLNEEILNTELNSSFRTVKLTVLHISDAEQIWTERLNGISPKYWPSADFIGNGSEAVEMLINSSVRLNDTVKQLSPEFINSEINFNDMKGNPHKAKVYDIIQHAVNHSTFHRGQVVTMLRELGIKSLPSTDYITFTRENP